MATRTLPQRDYVREALDYNPETGMFRWKERPRAHFRDTRAYKGWNRQFAGTIAGYSNPEGNYRIIIVLSTRSFKAHRLAWLLEYGEPVPALIDHIDGNPCNNQIRNLRAASPSESSANVKRPAHNTSGVKGVRFSKWTGRFEAFIRREGKTHWLGRFDTIEEATAVRREATIRLHGEFARHE